MNKIAFRFVTTVMFLSATPFYTFAVPDMKDLLHRGGAKGSPLNGGAPLEDSYLLVIVFAIIYLAFSYYYLHKRLKVLP